jgi:hypothetical protein
MTIQYPTTITIVAKSYEDASAQMHEWLEENHPVVRPLPPNAPAGSYWQFKGIFLPILRNSDGSPVPGVWSGENFVVHTER